MLKRKVSAIVVLILAVITVVAAHSLRLRRIQVTAVTGKCQHRKQKRSASSVF